MSQIILRQFNSKLHKIRSVSTQFAAIYAEMPITLSKTAAYTHHVVSLLSVLFLDSSAFIFLPKAIPQLIRVSEQKTPRCRRCLNSKVQGA
jgi:hypothetical protein